jgi:hypothetical protein
MSEFIIIFKESRTLALFYLPSTAAHSLLRQGCRILKLILSFRESLRPYRESAMQACCCSFSYAAAQFVDLVHHSRMVVYSSAEIDQHCDFRNHLAHLWTHTTHVRTTP